MKKKSRKKTGFTLLETVITMMIITIVLAAVYNGYIMLIRTTKDSEVKQRAALVGKKVVEEINNDSITSYDDIYFDKDGNEQKGKENYRYVAKISKDKYKDKHSKDILIGNTSNMYYVYESEISKEKKDKKDNEEKSFDKNIQINVKKDSGEKEGSISDDVITFRHDDSEKDTDDDKNINIALNFEAASKDSNITVEVNNECKAVVNLYILNSKINDSGDENVTVKNNKGKLNKIYKNGDSAGSISGTLYKITVAVSDRNSRGTMQDNLFKAEVLKNLRE